MGVRFVTCWNGPPAVEAAIKGSPAKPTRGCCCGAARLFDTNLQLLAYSCGGAASVIAGVPRGGQGAGVVNFRHVSGLIPTGLEAENA